MARSSSSTATPRQQPLFRARGGRRPGAGRPRRPGSLDRYHAPRPTLSARNPVLVTLRALPGVPSLRKSAFWKAVRSALRAASSKDGFRLVDFSVQRSHPHLIVEAADAKALSRGMQGLTIRVAKAVNKAAGRTGKLWAARYHAQVLRTPREVRNALCYVLQNFRRHADHTRGIVAPGWIDDRSSGPWFDGWRERVPPPPDDEPSPVVPARTWLLATGWRRHGLIGVDEIPRAAFS